MIYEKDSNFFITDGRFGKFKFHPGPRVSSARVTRMENFIVDALKQYRENIDEGLDSLKQAEDELHSISFFSGVGITDKLMSKQKARIRTIRALMKGGADVTACDGNFAILSDEVMISLSNRTWKRLSKEEWFHMENVRKDLKALIEELKVAS
jgi:hypothetical protein